MRKKTSIHEYEHVGDGAKPLLLSFVSTLLIVLYTYLQEKNGANFVTCTPLVTKPFML